jgi:uncharacterized protein (DUF736 family)
MGAVPISRQETVMATIGTFTKTSDGYTGTVSTLTLDAKVQVRPAEKASEKAPDFRIFAGRAEIGAAWKKTSNEGRGYLSVKLDDPSLPAPILANLFEMENGEHELIWSRPNGSRSRE